MLFTAGEPQARPLGRKRLDLTHGVVAVEAGLLFAGGIIT
jgi:hypothetical protein